ncbi:hypothetical protein AB0I60_22845 [Actinosynnema sp. NPDC050436]|uniref:hypothetical protein n=1 Tax=Actinosynnema sp. NPDC050436 TaxID=3155659 RepID=UPI0033D4D23B
MSPIRVVLAEDGVLLREGLASVLDRFGLPVVAAVGDAVELRDTPGGVGYLLKDRVADVEEFVGVLRRLVVSDGAVVEHVGNILAKLDLPPGDDTNRRVLAVPAQLRGRARGSARPAVAPLSRGPGWRRAWPGGG